MHTNSCMHINCLYTAGNSLRKYKYALLKQIRTRSNLRLFDTEEKKNLGYSHAISLKLECNLVQNISIPVLGQS